MNKDDFELNPAIRLEGGRVIRTIGDALTLLREHETRPGVDDRDEVLHALERADSDEARAAAVKRFRQWLETWSVVPVALAPGSSQGPR
jgi:hypothetical protein